MLWKQSQIKIHGKIKMENFNECMGEMVYLQNHFSFINGKRGNEHDNT